MLLAVSDGRQRQETHTHTHAHDVLISPSHAYLFIFAYLLGSLKPNMYLAVWLLWIRPVERLRGTILEEIRMKT